MRCKCIIKSEGKDYFLAIMDGHLYRIQKNELSKNFQKGKKVSFHARINKGLLINTLVPITEEEAGIKSPLSLASIGMSLEDIQKMDSEIEVRKEALKKIEALK